MSQTRRWCGMVKEAVTNSEIEQCLRNALHAEGYSLSVPRKHGETGVDVVAEKDREPWHIEVIGYKKVGAVRAKDFYEAFFRAVSRLNGGASHVVIALAKQAEVGLPARARQHRVAWQRIARAFPELEIWLVDTVNATCQRTSWGDWLK